MKKFKDFSCNFLFKISDQPVLLRDLLEANALFNDGMLVDPSKLNFNFKILNSYIYFGIFVLWFYYHYYSLRIIFLLALIFISVLSAL